MKKQQHAVKPSVDLEGGACEPIHRKPSTLSLRPSRTNLRELSVNVPTTLPPPTVLPPTVQINLLPRSSLSPHVNGPNYFSQLPRSNSPSGSPPSSLGSFGGGVVGSAGSAGSARMSPQYATSQTTSSSMYRSLSAQSGRHQFSDPPVVQSIGGTGRFVPYPEKASSPSLSPTLSLSPPSNNSNPVEAGLYAPTPTSNELVLDRRRRPPSPPLAGIVTPELLATGEPKIRKRPSLIITAAVAHDQRLQDTQPIQPVQQQQQQYGLALGITIPLDSASIPMPSPRPRRAYPSASPASANDSFFSAMPGGICLSPVDSPASPSSPYLSPSPQSFSATSATMERQPSSPRLGAFTEPLSRLAGGLVRRASNSNLNTSLPTSVSRSPSPSPSPTPSPSPSSPVILIQTSTSDVSTSHSNLSPSLPAAPIRRTSFAAQAREKEKEKELKELRERESKKRELATKHQRMFSWAERPSDFLSGSAQQSHKGITKLGSGLWLKKQILVIMVITGITLLGLYQIVGGGSTGGVGFGASQSASRGAKKVKGAYLRRSTNTGLGRTFIHPDVIHRAKPLTRTEKAMAPIRWVSHFITRGKINKKARREDAHFAVPSKRIRKPTDAASKQAEQIKSKSVFVSAPKTPFLEHKALPPPPVHDDAPERDTLVLYRILGNDLPPRHSPGQTLRNLRFLLQHESDFSSLPHIGPHLVHHAHLYGSGSKAQRYQDHSQGGGLRVDKYFVLNRISQPEMVSAIIGLLHLYSIPDSRILVIPFEWNEYQKHDFRWDGGVDRVSGWGIGDGAFAENRMGGVGVGVGGGGSSGSSYSSQSGMDDVTNMNMGSLVDPEQEGVKWKKVENSQYKKELLSRLRAMDFNYHEKNLYAMNNNGGRNFALEHGRNLPNTRWVLPLDGNSFFTPAAMYSIVQTLSISGEGDHASRYVVIPMARLLSNDDVKANNSISLVPNRAHHEHGSAHDDAILHHRPPHAPDTPEEPQIGFRYDSTESFQEAMRYGRRSKLEFLWRLGAIPYQRGLDRNTLSWEVSDRDHVTQATWGSIPGVDGAKTDLLIHQPHGEFKPWLSPDPERGPLAYTKAGWVYRLFSGHKSQEEPNSEAVTLRNINRIKGTIAFLERLDEEVSRGIQGCPDGKGCGFSTYRLWNFNSEHLERLRQKYKAHRQDAIVKVDLFEQDATVIHSAVAAAFKNPSVLALADEHITATNASILAMAGYLTGNSSYSILSAKLISNRFIKQMPLFYRQTDQREQMQRYHNYEETEEESSLRDDEAFAYAFPPPPINEIEAGGSWSSSLGRRVSAPDAPKLPFDVLNFDPSLLLDAVRLLTHPNAPQSELTASASRKSISSMVIAHLSHLLFSAEAIAFCKSPPSAIDGGLYDVKIGALAAFLDDARLLSRVANRARLRLKPAYRDEGLLEDEPHLREVHPRLILGLANTKMRPYSMVAETIAEDLLQHNPFVIGRASAFDHLAI